MRRTASVSLLAAMAGALLWSSFGQAQTLHPSECQDACHDEQTACVTSCARESNPVQCEAQCDEELADCLETCEEARE